MARTTLHQRADALLRRKQREHGVNLRPFRDYLLSRFLFAGPGEDVALEDLAGGIDDFVRAELPTLLPAVRELSAASDGKNVSDAAGRPKPRRIYPKTLPRRVEILSFVAERAVPLSSLLGRGCLDTGGRRIAWRAISGAWNAKHPHGRLTPEALRAAYNYAKSDERLISQLVDSFHRDATRVADMARAAERAVRARQHAKRPRPRLVAFSDLGEVLLITDSAHGPSPEVRTGVELPQAFESFPRLLLLASRMFFGLKRDPVLGDPDLPLRAPLPVPAAWVTAAPSLPRGR